MLVSDFAESSLLGQWEKMYWENRESEASVGASPFDKECRDGVTDSSTSGGAGSASVEGSSISNKVCHTDA